MSLTIYAFLGIMWILINNAIASDVSASIEITGSFALKTVLFESLIGATGTAFMAYRVSLKS